MGRLLAGVENGFRRHGAYSLLMLRLTPVLPFWVINLGMALTPIRPWAYWWTT